MKHFCGAFPNQAVAVFKCPSDQSVAQNGPRIRSMSMNSMVGDPGELTNRFNPQLVQFFRLASIPIPANIYVFLDEHPDTINDGFFMNRWDEYRWGNLPASYHNGAANLSFADGHVESHRWVLGDTRRPAKNGGTGCTRHKLMTLEPGEFMRRFLLHDLPGGFHRIRHYGLLAYGSRKTSLALARELLCIPAVAVPPADDADLAIQPPTFVCWHCGSVMVIVQTFTRGQAIRAPPARQRS